MRNEIEEFKCIAFLLENKMKNQKSKVKPTFPFEFTNIGATVASNSVQSVFSPILFFCWTDEPHRFALFIKFITVVNVCASHKLYDACENYPISQHNVCVCVKSFCTNCCQWV